jgi:hypothetical protein
VSALLSPHGVGTGGGGGVGTQPWPGLYSRLPALSHPVKIAATSNNRSKNLIGQI